MRSIIALISSVVAFVALGPTAEAGDTATSADRPTSAVTSHQILRVSRTRRSDGSLEARALDIAEVMLGEAPVVSPLFGQIASQALRDPNGFGAGQPFENWPSVLVTYDAREDDVMIIDPPLVAERPTDLVPWASEDTPDPGIGETAARGVYDQAVVQLSARGVISASFQTVEPTVRHNIGVSQGSSGGEEGWIQEYIFEANFPFSGAEVIDLGLRVSVHRDGRISSIRTSAVRLQKLGSETHVVDANLAAQKLTSFVRGQYPSLTSVVVLQQRFGYIMAPTVESVDVGPRHIFNYYIDFPDASSRQFIAAVSGVDGAVEILYPQVQAPVP